VLEFVLVYFLAKRNGDSVEAKGRRGTKYRWLTAGLWFAGEIGGAIVGAMLTTGFGIYAIALGGAVLGAAVAWFIADSVQLDQSKVWLPNAVTPPAGIAVWAQPDGSRPSVGTMPGGMELMVEARLGDWAQVRTVNGWRGFVDARTLASRTETMSAWQAGSGH
jgi:hypothetical protein